MEKIISILIERDHMTRDEALNLIQEVKDMMEKCNYDPEECEDIFMTEFGLEPDYIPYFLFG